MGEYGINQVQLFEVDNVTDMDVTASDIKIAEERRQKELKIIEAAERAQYEKLHAKFNIKKEVKND
jgi:hypothetical protein